MTSLSTTLDELRSGNAQLRRVTAIKIGKTGDESFVPQLIQALLCEPDDAAAASMILALGAIGGKAAIEALDSIRPLGERSTTALRMARGRLIHIAETVRWRDNLAIPDVFLEVPTGLERPATLLLRKDHYPKVELARPGLLRFSGPISLDLISPPPRWSYRFRILLGRQNGVDDQHLDALLQHLASTTPFYKWLEIPDGVFRYRIAVEGRTLDKPTLSKVIQKFRTVLEPENAVDSPSNYSAELILSFEGNSLQLYLRPHFYVDDRFSYRERDVHASMNPVVAAALAQLAPVGSRAAVIDPVCGSGVPLIERGKFDPQSSPLIGLDIDPSAIAAANTNVAAAGLTGRASIRQADARNPDAWETCGLVVANLPYGLRLKSSPGELLELYMAIAKNAARHLLPNGRLIIASAYKEGIERTLASAPLRTLARYRVETGGLFVQVAVLGKQ